MSFRIIVLAKQVPDTRKVGKDAMKADGTVNRAALPAIFNPEDLHALEFALKIKETLDDVEIILITMGPPRAAEIIREGLYRGIDKGILITDKRFAGSDTLATSYVLSRAIQKLSPFHLVIAGRQAIDGDTAQVGPQVAEKLNIPQITYAESLETITNEKIIVKRRLERGIEIVSSPYPVLITVNNTADPCRSYNALMVLKYKKAKSITELQEESSEYNELYEKRPYLVIPEWGVEDIEADQKWLGLSGSPTKVKKIENVVLTAKESQVFSAKDEDIDLLMKKLIESRILG
ncbi:MAG: electron transfer flavoprotein subunit beta/FixA family protein [Bacteroidales bacterium]|nr:electron transfer flavoprotein subunit beta/FixA family protein [Bacteroidales bacterium]